MPCILFKDIAKTANNTLNDDYDFNRKLKIKTKTANNVSFTTEGTMSSNKAILAKMSAGFSHSCGLNVSKLQVTTHGRLIGEANINNALLDGLKLTLKAEDGSLRNPAGVKYKPVGKVGAEYRLDSLSTTAEADFANNLISASAVFGYDNFVFGGQGALNIEKSKVSDQNLAVSYCGKDFHASVVTKKNFQAVSVSFDHKPCNNAILAAVLDHDVKAKTHALTVGGRYKPDSETTFCSKVNSDGIASLACVQQVRPMVAMTFSANIDVKNIAGESHKLGLALTLG